jgi:membrane protein YdbS with pleckstrin-like domain
MAVCPSCGAVVSGRFCAQCGRPAGADSTAVIDVPTGDGTQFLQPMPPARPIAPGPPVVRASHTPSIASVPNPTMAVTDDNRFTEAAEHVLNTVGERTVWQGTPSLLYLIKPALGWALLIAIVTIGLAQLTLPFDWGWGILALAVLGLLKIGTAWLRLHNTRYRLSSQRLEKTEGLLSRTTVTVELMNIKRAVITEPFPWRLFGLGDLELDAATGEHWKLYGISGATTVRDLIHSSSGIGGQLWDQRRFGN